jgi:hypothetical protein
VTCREAIALLAVYLEATLSPDAGERVAGHLESCEPCRSYLRTYRKTIEVVAAAERNEMPDEMKERLRAFLLAELTRGPATQGA